MAAPLGRPPGPIGWPLLGVLLDFRENPAEFLRSVTREYGDMSYFRLGLERIYLLNRPDLIEEVLITHPNNFTEAQVPGLPAEPRPQGSGLSPGNVDLESALPHLAWPLYLLSQNPAAEARLRDELQTVLGSRAPTEDDFTHLDYTGGVILESLRLYPPVWLLARRNRTMMRLYNYHVSGKSICLISPFLIHRNPRFWPDPERFDPDRFLPGASATRPRFAYFPFGDLLTNAHATLVSLTLELAAIAQQWRFHPLTDQPVDIDPRRPLRPRGGLPMKAERL